MLQLFVDGGVGWMTILTLILIGLFLAAWKAPSWVKEIGIIAAIWGIIGALIGLMSGADAIYTAGNISQKILWGGLKMVMIPMVYGLIIYIISLIIRIIQKPRI